MDGSTKPKTLVLVTGSAPGLGKSTLARAIATALEHEGLAVNHFPEEEIRSHPAFSAVMSAFASTGAVPRTTLLDAASEYIEWARATDDDVFVLDSLFAYLPSLLAWGDTDDEIMVFFEQMAARFAGVQVIELHLVGDVRAALLRAADREGGDWLERHLAKLARYRDAPLVVTIDDGAELLEHLAERSMRLLASAPWPVELIAGAGHPDAALAAAMAAVAPALSGREPRRSRHSARAPRT